MASQHFGKGAFAAAITPHHCVDFPSSDREVHPFKDWLLLNPSVQITNFEQYRGVWANHSR